MEVVMAAYEVSTVVTDVILNHEYIQRKWVEEYALSLAFLGFNGLVMGLVGIALERRLPPRYTVRAPALNTLAAFALGVLQLRVLTETVFVFAAERRARAVTTTPPQPQAAVANANPHAPPPPPLDDAVSVKRLEDGLRFAAFVQAIVRDIPLFIIQANATIHYRKWQLLDLYAVTSTGLTLLFAVGTYVCKRDTGALRAAGYFFLFGQFVLRAGAILLVAMTTKLLVVQYAGAIIGSSVLWSTWLRTAHTDRNGTVNLTRALVFFPFFTLFVVDASRLTSRRGSTRQTLLGAKLWPLHGWRVLECVAGALFAVYGDRYNDFGPSTDATIVRAAAVCGGVYAISLAVCVGVALFTLPTKEEALFREPSVDDDDSPVVIAQQQPQLHHHPHAAYSTMAAQA